MSLPPVLEAADCTGCDVRALVECVPIGLLTVAADTWTVLWHNPAVARIFGRPMKGERLRDYIHPDDLEHGEATAAINQVTDEAVISYENRYVHADGHEMWVTWNVQNRPGLFYCAIEDTTLRHRIGEALKVAKRLATTQEIAEEVERRMLGSPDVPPRWDDHDG